MYEAHPDPAQLRQGDVIKDIYLPRYTLKDLQVISTVDLQGQLKPVERAILKTDRRWAVVISQCCEFNEGKRNAFSLADLRPASIWLRIRSRLFGINLGELLPLSKTPFRKGVIEQLKQANKLDNSSGHNQAVNAYFFDADGTHLLEPHIVDFTQVISIRMEDRAAVLSNKVLQMDVTHRKEFQAKLGYFYARPAE